MVNSWLGFVHSRGFLKVYFEIPYKCSIKANSKRPMLSIDILATLMQIIRPNPMRLDLFCKQKSKGSDYIEQFYFNVKLYHTLVGSQFF